MDSTSAIITQLNASIQAKQRIAENSELIARVNQSIDIIAQAIITGHRVLFCGNGGSAADAQHLAAELSGRFKLERRPFDAEALHCNSSYLTAVGNDYGYDEVFARMVQAGGHPGDVLVAISTSGNSTNVVKACQKAASIGMAVIGLTGQNGGAMQKLCSVLLNVPTADTPHIQECHITLGHIICDQVEQIVCTLERQ